VTVLDKALRKRASMIVYRPKPPRRGWYIRKYHSTFAMEQALKGKGEWDSYGETGPFRTEEEAREFASAELAAFANAELADGIATAEPPD
jgi:hypothetical protein